MTVLSRAYGRVASMRRAWYERRPDRQRRLARPVISVGNLAVGGSGKTPIVAALAQLLVAQGERPSILSRGYGRRRSADGVVVVSAGGEVLVDSAVSGDEPQMLARALPGVVVLVSPDRHLAGTLAERRFGCSVHLLDDGFQHVQLARTVDLVAISRGDLEERVLPGGRLREPLDAVARADAVLIGGDAADAAAVQEALRPAAAFRVVADYLSLRLLVPFGAPLSNGDGRRAVAVSAIARPERFSTALRAQGWDVAREITFRDHHWFRNRDMKKIEAAAQETGAHLVITTEKDAMRLLGDPDKVRATGVTWAYLPMRVAIEPADRFASWLRGRLGA